MRLLSRGFEEGTIGWRWVCFWCFGIGIGGGVNRLIPWLRVSNVYMGRWESQ
jgi:hypothetical protein